MTAERELTRRVVGVTGILGVVMALGLGMARGPADGAGAALGSVLMLANFGGLAWGIRRALGGGVMAPGKARALWLSASGARLGLLGTVAGLAVAQGWVGLVGLALSLALLPAGVVVAGLATARSA